MTFEALGLMPELLRAVRDQGYEAPTPIQAQAIPHVLAGRDLMAGAQTGTGKTAGFALPILQMLSRQANSSTSPARHPIRCLVLTPTRELCMQVEESFRTYGRHIPLRTTTLFGGVNINPQTKALRAGVEIVVATPGRLLDHHGQGNLHFGALEILVLDEADRMLDMGFIRDLRKILALLPSTRQTLLFSATFGDDIRDLAGSFLRNPVSVDVAARNAPAELVTQVIHPVDRERKRALLTHLIRTRNLEQVLVFCRTKHGASRLADQLEKDGIDAAAIHGNKSQPQRIKALADFKAGAVKVLVATDIASRGLDIDQLPHVVNFELPPVPEDYIHRIGRTGRAGVEGEALSLVCVDEHKLMRDIEKLLKRPLPREVVPGFEPDPSAQAQPLEIDRGARGARPGRPGRSGAAPGRTAPHAASSGAPSSRAASHAPTGNAASGRSSAHAPSAPSGGSAEPRPARRRPSGSRTEITRL